MTRGINPNTATEFYRVEAWMPPPADKVAVVNDYATLDEAVSYANKAREVADTMVAMSTTREVGQLKIWRARATTHGGRMQLNLIPEDVWRETPA